MDSLRADADESWMDEDAGADLVRLRRWHRCGGMLYKAADDFLYPAESGAGPVRACPSCRGVLILPDVLTGLEMLAQRDAAWEKHVFPELLAGTRTQFGRGGLPDDLVSAIYHDYARGYSLEEVGLMWARTRQAVFELFARCGLAMREKLAHDGIEWRGRTFAPGKSGYLRATKGDRELLHVLVWREAHGEIPEGAKLTFKDGNRHNTELDNLELVDAKRQIDDARDLAKRTGRVNQFSAAVKDARNANGSDDDGETARLFAEYRECGSMSEVARRYGLDPFRLFQRFSKFTDAKRRATA